MKTKEQKLRYLFDNDNELLKRTMEAINYYDRSFDFVETHDLKDLCDSCGDYGNGDDVYALVSSIVMGNVTNLNQLVRYDGYANLYSISEKDLLQECLDSSYDCIKYIVDYCSEGGFLCNLDEDIIEIMNSEEEEDEAEEEDEK